MFFFATVSVFRGQSYTGISKFMEACNIQFISHNTYYEYQRDLIIPAVDEEFNLEMTRQIEKLKLRGITIVTVMGNGKIKTEMIQTSISLWLKCQTYLLPLKLGLCPINSQIFLSSEITIIVSTMVDWLCTYFRPCYTGRGWQIWHTGTQRQTLHLYNDGCSRLY